MLFPALAVRALAAQNAKVIGSEVEIYAEGNFDSEVVDYVREGETYQISDKTYGPFYRIKLKNGRIGYIVDYQLDVEGKGRIVPKDLDQVLLEEEQRRLKNRPPAPPPENPEEPSEEDFFGRDYGGFTVQLINYHEDTMGGVQIADLLALGYKAVVPLSSGLSWSVIGSYGAPKYYAEKTGGSARGVKLWADLGFSNPMVSFQSSDLRIGASVFSHVSLLTVETPARSYDLHDITAGLALEGGWLWKFNQRKNALDLAVKYYFDKTSYAGFGLSYLF